MQGGLKFFSNRSDNVDLIADAKAKGYSIVTNMDQWNAMDINSPTIALMAADQMSYQIDQNPNQPTLLQMAQRALDMLDGDSFFLMIEASLIDIAGNARMRVHVC